MLPNSSQEAAWITKHEKKRMIDRRRAAKGAQPGREQALKADAATVAATAVGGASVPQGCSKPTVAGEGESPVGLAISGGGIRSGSTAVGLLQSLYSNGLLRYLDYLSTVSGGTYAGAFLASQLASLGNGETAPINLTPKVEDPESLLLPMHSDSPTGQKSSIRHLALAGERWKRPLEFLQQHLPGFLLVNSYVFSACLAIAALAAMLFRAIDLPTPSRYLSVMGFDSDLSRAFVPAFVTFLIWLLCFPFRHYRPVAVLGASAYGLLIASLAMGTVSLFSTANLDISSLEKGFGWSPEVGVRVRGAISWLGQTLTIFFGFALLPLVNAQRLLRSGTSSNQMERWLFNAISTTLLMGIPLMMFYYLSMEGISISSKPAENEPRMTKSHVVDWKGLAEELRADREDADLSDRISNLATQLGLNLATPPAVQHSQPPRTIETPAYDPISLDLPAPNPVSVTDPGTSVASNTAQAPRGAPTAGTNRESSPEKFVVLLRWKMSNRLKKKLMTPHPWSQNQTTGQSGITLEQLVAEKPAVNGSFLGKFLSFPADVFEHFRHGDRRIADLRPIDIKKDNLTSDRITHSKLYDMHQNELAERLDNGLIGHANLLQEIVASGPDGRGTNPKNALQLFNDRFETELARRPAFDDPALRAYSVGQPITDGLLREEYRAVLLLKLLRHADAIDNNPTKGRDAGDSERLNNWNILRVLYGPRIFHSPREIFASNVAAPDFTARFKIFLLSLLVFLALGLISVNVTTMQGFYRDQLSESWIPHDTRDKQLALHDATKCQTGAPLLLINATVNLHGYPNDGARSKTERYLLSPLFVGSERVGFQSTSSFFNGKYTLGDATAISAAAVSPVAHGNVLSRALLVVLNLRLGQWLPRPNQEARTRPILDYPMPHRLLWEHLSKSPEERSFLFVTDGGHHENTGIESLLVRRCRVIIAADFSEDPDYAFADFRKLCLRACETLGITLRQDKCFPLDSLIPDPTTKEVKAHLALFEIDYPPQNATRGEHTPDSHDNKGWLILLKPGLSGDEPAGLRECRRDFSQFPHDPTGDQLFEESRFMAYRQLGEHLGDELFRFLNTGGDTRGQDVSRDRDDILWLSQHWAPAPNVKAESQAAGQTTGQVAVDTQADSPGTVRPVTSPSTIEAAC